MSATTQSYLKAVLELEEIRITPRRARLVEGMGHSGPTVSEAVRRMEANGLCFLSGPENVVTLTETGRRAALSVMRKHRLLESFFLGIVGLDLTEVHNEACRWEHVVSDRAAAGIAALLQHPTHDPFGNPIPAEHGAGIAMTGGRESLARRLEVSDDPVVERVSCIGERIQADQAAVAQLFRAGIGVGTLIRVTVVHDADVVELACAPDGPSVRLPQRLTPWLLLVPEATDPRFFSAA